MFEVCDNNKKDCSYPACPDIKPNKFRHWELCGYNKPDVVIAPFKQNPQCYYKHTRCCIIDFRIAEAIGWLQKERVELPDGDWKYIKLR